MVVVLSALNGSAASLLITAGCGKLVSPAQPLLALREVLGERAKGLSPRSMTAVAVCELATALLLVIAPVRMLGAAAAALLGLAFAALGVAGRLKSTTVPCGCLGASGGRPLGPANVAAGAALVSLPLWNALIEPPGEYAGAVLLVAAGGALAACLWMHRALIGVLARRPAVR